MLRPASALGDEILRVALGGRIGLIAGLLPERGGARLAGEHQTGDALSAKRAQTRFDGNDELPGESPPTVLGVDRQAVHLATPAVPAAHQAPDEAVAIPGQDEQLTVPFETAVERIRPIGRAGHSLGPLPERQNGVDILVATGA